MKPFWKPLVMAVWMLGIASTLMAAEPGKPRSIAVYPTAVFSFQERGDEVKGYGSQVTDLLVADLAEKPEMFLVDRADLEKSLDELSLSLSGMVEPSQAVKVGQLTGAKILVTGSVIQVENSLHLTAKIIGTETSRIVGASVQDEISGDLANLTRQLADAVAQSITQHGRELVAQPTSQDQQLAALRAKLGRGKRPAVLLEIPEHHVGQVVSDPAAQTELAMICQKLGFRVIDAQRGSPSEADVIVTGEGLTELAARHGELISVKGRLEVKALDRKSGRVLAIDRQTTVAVDLTEQIAGKLAMQEAAAAIAPRLLPKIAQAVKKP